MPDYTYLIIGGGMAASAAVNGIRQLQASESIGIISSDSHKPYNRPPLTKGLWKGESFESVQRRMQEHNVEMHLSTTAVGIDVGKKTVTDDQGLQYRYDKLLLATGGRVKRFPFDAEGVIYYRTLDDYKRLRERCEQGSRFAVIGSGFIGSEIAAALAMNNKTVTMIFPGGGIGSGMYPPRLSYFLNTYYRSKGVELLAHETVEQIEERGGRFFVKTSRSGMLEFDGVVAGIGIEPDTTLAEAAGCEISNGIVVDEFLRTTRSNIYAAGDVANFYNPTLAKRIRVEHEDNANTMGELAGNNMAGIGIAYVHLPFFYSDLFDLGYEAIGELDAKSEIIEDWNEEFREGVIYYMNAARVRGVLLWNKWGLVDEARRLIAEKGPIEGRTLRGRL
ncbi:MAG TPA: FAD-dependent oxidoreductase [Bacteroidota bacterium]|nr:FAD-dependent oxidoreductase [Bacteroidota bacterium]